MLLRTTPESVGISSSVISRFIDSLAELDSVHSFMLLRHGKVAAELWNAPYRPDVPHELFSLSKSFTSAAIGFARQEGKLQLDDSVAEFFPEKLPRDPDPRFLRMTVRHLLTMSSGHDRCALCYMINQHEPDFVKSFFRSPLVYEPGSRFVYNSGATYMLSAIIRRLTGENLTDYLRPRLFAPLGFGEREWEKDPQGTELGGWGFRLTTEEIARFAQLLLDGGRWEGQQILPADYLELATSFQIDNSMNSQPDWQVGYGFQFWRCRHNAYRGDGAFGQYALVMPDQDAALAVTSGMRNMQSVLDRVWDILLPAMQQDPLPEATVKQQALRARIACAAFPVLPGPGRECHWHATGFEPNSIGAEALRVESTATSCRLILRRNGVEEFLEAGFGRRIDNHTRFGCSRLRRIAASAAWQDDGTLEVLAHLYETPYRLRFLIRCENGTMTLERNANLLFFGLEEWPLLHGRLSNA